MKRSLKNAVNKRRKHGDYVRKGKKRGKGCEGPETEDKMFKFSNTATKESLALLAMKVDAMHSTESHLTRRRRLGQLQKAIKEKGLSLKKERSYMLAPSIGPSARPSRAGVEFDNIELEAQEY